MSSGGKAGRDTSSAPGLAHKTEKVNMTILLGFLLPIAILSIWQVATDFQLISPQLLVPPEKVFRCLIKLILNGELWKNLRSSLSLVLLGYTWGILAGIALGTLMATFKTVDHLIHPIIQAIRQIPLFGWLPFLILLFGIGREFKIIFIGLGSFYVMVVNAYEGVKSVSPEHLEVSRIFGIGYVRRFLGVIIPEAMPYIFTGLKTGLSLSWMTVVGAEMVASSLGIGFMMSYSRTMFKYDVVYSMVFVIGVVGFLMNFIVGRIEKYVLRWRSTYISSN